MSKKGYSRPGFFGSINHYDETEKSRREQTRILWWYERL